MPLTHHNPIAFIPTANPAAARIPSAAKDPAFCRCRCTSNPDEGHDMPV
jgi:hypothetical protein